MPCAHKSTEKTCKNPECSCDICKDCGHIDKRYLKECPHCHSQNVDYLTRVIGYLKRVSNFSLDRQKEAARRFYAKAE